MLGNIHQNEHFLMISHLMIQALYLLDDTPRVAEGIRAKKLLDKQYKIVYNHECLLHGKHTHT